ncbi:MAG: Ribosome hibernation promoting factor [Bacteroidota bacterium]|jgi:putative sigma-54 modulation protein
MNLNIQSIHFDADQKLIQFIKDRLVKLNHFHDGIIESNVFLRIDKSSTTENKVAEIKLHVSGHDLFAKRQSATFEEAFDSSVDALTRQLKKQKEKARLY